MIQRIQTLYLLGVMVIIIVLMTAQMTICQGYYTHGSERSEFNFNVITTTLTRSSVEEMRVDAADGAIKSSMETEAMLNPFLFICTIFCGIVCLLSIFAYKNLKRQKRLVLWNMAVLAVFYVSVYVTYLQALNNPEGLHANWSIMAIVLMLLMIIFNYLAYRKIVKDIELLASVDRLR